MLRLAKKPDHRPADPKEARKLVSEMISGDTCRSLDQLMAWIETLTATAEVRLDRRFESISVFEEAAIPLERRIARDYVRSGRLQSVHEQRLWTVAHDLWHHLAVGYQLCLMEYEAGASGAASLQSRVPVIACRAVRALRKELKWVLLRYGAVNGRLWQEAARVYRTTESLGFAHDEVTMYPHQTWRSTVEREYVKMLLLAVSSPNSLPPPQLEIAGRLASRCAEFTPLESVQGSGATHTIDLGKSRPPQRVRGVTEGVNCRYLESANALPHLERISKVMTQPGSADAAQIAGHDPRMIREVAQHLALYWSANPPIRCSERHPTMARISVVPGFQGLLEALQGYVGGPFIDDAAESWMAENVSKGGYGAAIEQIKGDWLRVGSLVGVKPESAPAWGVGVIRRMSRDGNKQPHVGIESFAKAAIPVHIAPVGAHPNGALDHFPNAAVLALTLKSPGEIDMVLEAGGFSPRLNMEMVVRGIPYILVPIGFVEGGDDFDLARYRIQKREAA